MKTIHVSILLGTSHVILAKTLVLQACLVLCQIAKKLSAYMMTDGYSDSPQGSAVFELNNGMFNSYTFEASVVECRLIEITNEGMKIPALGFGAMKRQWPSPLTRGSTFQARRLTVCYRRLSSSRRRERLCPQSHSTSHYSWISLNRYI